MNSHDTRGDGRLMVTGNMVAFLGNLGGDQFHPEQAIFVQILSLIALSSFRNEQKYYFQDKKIRRWRSLNEKGEMASFY